jgi:hypothetical protein
MQNNKTLATFGLTMFLVAMAPHTVAVTLIKNDEAKLPAASGVLTSRGISRGPGVKIVSPDLAQTTVTSPFDLKINFESRGGVKIDPAATKVVYLKSKPVDLLPRVQPALSESGINLQQAEVPPGEHTIQITVQDVDGRVTNTFLQLNVVK